MKLLFSNVDSIINTSSQFVNILDSDVLSNDDYRIGAAFLKIVSRTQLILILAYKSLFINLIIFKSILD